MGGGTWEGDGDVRWVEGSGHGLWVDVPSWMVEWLCILDSMARPEYHFMMKLSIKVTFFTYGFHCLQNYTSRRQHVR